MPLKDLLPPPRAQLTAESLQVIEALAEKGCTVVWPDNGEPAMASGQAHTPVEGRFYVSVDDEAVVYVNDHQIRCGGEQDPAGSPEISVAPGDLITVELFNRGGQYRFKMAFLPEDGDLLCH